MNLPDYDPILSPLQLPVLFFPSARVPPPAPCSGEPLAKPCGKPHARTPSCGQNPGGFAHSQTRLECGFGDAGRIFRAKIHRSARGSRIMPREPASRAGSRGWCCSPISPMQAIKTFYVVPRYWVCRAAAPSRQCRRLRLFFCLLFGLLFRAAAPSRQCRRLRLHLSLSAIFSQSLQPHLANAGD